jgi:UDP-3-O-[3-hydroxymyristoyl] glucosamine N-acyltransferase
MTFTIKEVAQLVGGTVAGDDSQTIHSLAKIQEAFPGSITFLANPVYEKYLYTTQATAVLVQEGFQVNRPLTTALIFVKDPYAGFTSLLKKFEAATALNLHKQGVEQPVYLSEGVQVTQSMYIGAFSYIGKGAQLGEGVQIYPHSYIGDQVVIGENTILYSGVKIYAGCHIGKNCIIHAGAVIGSDGFGFAPNNTTGEYIKIPHIGQVIIEDSVEIGANTTIDRATTGYTRIKQGSKIDNLVQIAHNVEVGKHTVIAAFTGIAGSAKVGNHCRIGGQVGIAGHTEMGDKTIVAGQAGVTKSYKDGNITLMGMPAVERKKYLKNYAVFNQLYKLIKKLDI